MQNEKVYAKIRKALLKRALGYDTSEVVEEYAKNDDDMTVVRKKVTTKNVPPDISAAKMLLEDIEKVKDDYADMTDEQLAKERERLLGLIKEKMKSEDSK